MLQHNHSIHIYMVFHLLTERERDINIQIIDTKTQYQLKSTMTLERCKVNKYVNMQNRNELINNKLYKKQMCFTYQCVS